MVSHVLSRLHVSFEEGGEVAAVLDDAPGELPPQRVARDDAEVATDIGDDGANRAAATRGAMGMAGASGSCRSAVPGQWHKGSGNQATRILQAAVGAALPDRLA